MHAHHGSRSFAPGHLLGVVVALLTGCSSSTSSTNLDTAGFHVTYVIVGHAAEPIRAIAVFRVGDASGSYLELVGGDAITVDGSPLRAVDHAPYLDDLASPHWTGLHYEGDVAAGVEHVFTFTRDGEPPVSRSIAEALRPAPTVDGLSTATALFADPIALAWTPVSGSTVSVVAVSPDTAHCYSLTLATGLDDVGVYALDAARLHSAADTTACGVRVTVVRTHDQAIGAPFRGGALRTIASGSMELTLR